MTNITDEDFTHNYGGAPFTVRAKESLSFPYVVGVHLARHLARKILISGDKGATSWDPKDPTSNGGNGTVLFTQEAEELKMKEILGEEYTVDTPAKKSEIDLLKEEIAKLNDFRKGIEEDNKDVPKISEDSELDTLDRSGLIAKVKELGIKFSPTDKNNDLKEKIMAKMAG